MTDTQQVDLEDSLAQAPAEPVPEPPKKTSGFQRLKSRHHRLIAEHEALLAEHEALQAVIEDAAKEAFEAKIARHPSWFLSANRVITELAANPDARAFDTMTASLATLLQKVAQIKLKVTA